MIATIFKRAAIAMVVASSVAVPFAAQAQDGPWLVRLRAVNLDSANTDSTGARLSLSTKVFPEVDVSYFFTPQIAVELMLTYPQRHTLSSFGTEIGSLKHLPTTMTLQYHFVDKTPFRPYVGLGLNYTRYSSVEFTPAASAALKPSLSNASFGAAVQAGFDYAISKTTYLNFDVKKVKIGTDVYSFGAKVGEFKADPWLIGVGVGLRF